MHDDPETLRREAEAAEALLSDLARSMIAVLEAGRLRHGKAELDAFLGSAVAPLAQINRACAQYNIRHRAAAGYPHPLRLPLQRRLTTPEFFEDALYRQRLWRAIEQALVHALGAAPVPLYPAPRPSGEIEAEQARLMDGGYRTLHGAMKTADQDPAAEAHGCYSDIPMRMSAFVGHLHAAMRVALAQGRVPPLRFLDVGCGIGVTVLMATEIFHQADGLEFDAGYAGLARGLMARTGYDLVNIIEGDALTFEGYDQYDVVYFYQPMRDETLLMALERRVTERATPGTVLIAPYDAFAPRAAGLGFVHATGSVYLSPATDDAAQMLRTEAEHIGMRSPHPAKADTPRAGYLLPLLAALRAAGHGII